MTPTTTKKPDVRIEEIDLIYLIQQSLEAGLFGLYRQGQDRYYVEVVVPEGHGPHDPKIVVMLTDNRVPGINTSMTIDQILSRTCGYNPDALIDDQRSHKTKR